VVKPLSEGGMGAVYVVEQRSTGRQRALKLMLPQLVADPKLRARFEQEARIGSRIESEHIVEVVGAGVEEPTGAPWLAMELLRGEDLASLVRRLGALPQGVVLDIVEQLCHAVGAAHAVGIVHRDLKPENVFLAASRRTGASYMVKVLDFGIAKVVAEAKTTQTAALGSPMWMSPEQTARGGAIGPQTDVWAIGLIVFHLLTGRFFWRSAEDDTATMTHLLREIVMDPMPTATQRAAEVGKQAAIPAGFDGWFARSLDRNPSARFANAREQFAALAAVCGNSRPITAATVAAAPIETPAAPPIARTVAQPPPYGPGQTMHGPVGHAAPAGIQPTTAQGVSASMPFGMPPSRGGGGGGLGLVLGLVGGAAVLGLGVLGAVFYVGHKHGSAAAEPASTLAVESSTTAPPPLVDLTAGSAIPDLLPPGAPVASGGSTSTARAGTPGVGGAGAGGSGSGSGGGGSGGGTGGGTGGGADPSKCGCPAGDLMCAMTCASRGGGGGNGGGGSSPPPDSDKPFDRGAAITSLGPIASGAQSCKHADDPAGTGHVKITFAPSGTVQSAVVDTPPFAGTATGGCVAGRFRGARVPPFSGSPVTVGKSFIIN
jgi:eukaryotic-like serine/threonine-protein kinase